MKILNDRLQEMLIDLYPFKRGSIPANNEDVLFMKKLWYDYFQDDVLAREARRAVVGYAVGFVNHSSNYTDLISKEQLEDCLKTYNHYYKKLEDSANDTKLERIFCHSKMEVYAIASMIADYISEVNKPMCSISNMTLTNYQKDYILDVFLSDRDLAEDRAVNVITLWDAHFTDKVRTDGFDVEWLGKTMNVLYFETQYSNKDLSYMKGMIELSDDWSNYYVPRILVSAYTKSIKLRAEYDDRNNIK